MSQDVSKYAEDLDAILALARAMAGEYRLDVLLDLILDAAKRLTDADRCSCFVIDEHTGELLTRIAHGSRTIRLPRGSGIAGAVAESGEVLNLPDVNADPRFNPEHDRSSGYVTRSMLCMPLCGHEGIIVGVLQALNKQAPDETTISFGEYDERILRLLGNQAAVALQTAQWVERDRERQRLARDMELARSIQRSLCPTEPPTVVGWRFAAWQRSCDATGGDYYDYLPCPAGCDLIVGDVSGHGLGAALYMSTARACLRALHGTAPSERVLERVNVLLESDLSDDSFMTLLLVGVDEDGRVAYVSAGHDPPLIWRRAAGSCQPAGEDTGLLLGALPEAHYQATVLDRCAAGDLLVLYTDGIVEATNAAEEEWGRERLQRAVAAVAPAEPQAVVAAVIEAVTDWQGPTAVADDWTILVAERCA